MGTKKIKKEVGSEMQEENSRSESQVRNRGWFSCNKILSKYSHGKLMQIISRQIKGLQTNSFGWGNFVCCDVPSGFICQLIRSVCMTRRIHLFIQIDSASAKLIQLSCTDIASRILHYKLSAAIPSLKLTHHMILGWFFEYSRTEWTYNVHLAS